MVSWAAFLRCQSKVCWQGTNDRDNLRDIALSFSLSDLIVLLVLGLAALYFLAAVRVRELALKAVGLASRRDDFQLLDQSVHIRRLSLSRDGTGRWRIWRQYRFDYSFDGVERRQGFVIMLGGQLQSIVVSERAPTVH